MFDSSYIKGRIVDKATLMQVHDVQIELAQADSMELYFDENGLWYPWFIL